MRARRPLPRRVETRRWNFRKSAFADCVTHHSPQPPGRVPAAMAGYWAMPVRESAKADFPIFQRRVSTRRHGAGDGAIPIAATPLYS